MTEFLSFKVKRVNGFTLLEMIISIGIFVLVATASSVLFNQGLRAYRYTTSRTAAAREAELAMARIVQEIRLTNPTDGSPIPICTGVPGSDDDEITLSFDFDCTTANNHIRYLRQAADSTIRRERFDDIGSPRDLLAENVNSLSFGYFDGANQPVTPDLAVTVEIIIETQVNDQTFRLYGVANR